MKQRSDYFYFTQVSTRWKDNDVYGHVNNVTFYSYFDTVANEYLIERGGLNIQTSSVIGFVVASNCEYLAPIAYPQRIEAAFRVNKLGTSSAQYGVAVFKQGQEQASAHGTFTHVFVDRQTSQPVKIPEQIRQALEAAVV